jgi:hypothetical protein
MRKKSFIILLVAVVVLGGVIGGVFAGGVAIGKGQGREEASQEMQDQFSQFSSRFGTGEPGQTPSDSRITGGFLGGQGTAGTVEKIEGNVITLDTINGVVSILIDDDTFIQKMDEGGLDDISTGERITVTGEAGDDGSIEATDIFVMPEGLQTP